MKYGALFLCAAALGFSATVCAEEDSENMAKEIRRLQEELKENRREMDEARKRMDGQDDTIRALQHQRSALMSEEVASYLAVTQAAQGGTRGPLDGLRISIGFVGVLQATLGNDPANRHAGDGTLMMDFEATVTENLSGFVHIIANTGPTGNPTGFGSFSPPSGGSSFGPIGAPTATGIFDGVGVDGTQSFNASPIDIYEAGIRTSITIGDHVLHWEMGGLDPRKRFSQNAFADDELTQFINNSFDDGPAVNWITTAPRGVSVFGLHMWMQFGANKQITVNWGWFNAAGQVFSNGQFYIQAAWKGEVNGREMNLRVFGFLDAYTEASVDEDVGGGGASWDWWATETAGVFVRVNANGGDFNPVDFDASGGVVFRGLIGSRPDDTLGIAVGFISLQTVTTGPIASFVPTEDTEFTLEVYYRYMTEDGKLQFTPHLIYISDPAGGVGWTEDSLFILGFRIFVPF